MLIHDKQQILFNITQEVIIMKAITLTGNFGVVSINSLNNKNIRLGDIIRRNGVKYIVISDICVEILKSYFKKVNVVNAIGDFVDYKDAIKEVSFYLRACSCPRHTRHEFERDAISDWGGHTHSKRIRAMFI